MDTGIDREWPRTERTRHIIVGISGASGAVYGVRLLEVLASNPFLETHLVITEAARKTIETELETDIGAVCATADHLYNIRDTGAAIASGSFRTDGMIVAPCSMKSLSAIAYSHNDNLLTRAADVVLKERRRLVLLPRETPLHLGHLRAMVQVTEMGAIVMPPVPGFYYRPHSLAEVIDQTVNRALDLLGIDLEADLFPRWEGNAAGRGVGPTDRRR